jgi:hypothetical protein
MLWEKSKIYYLINEGIPDASGIRSKGLIFKYISESDRPDRIYISCVNRHELIGIYWLPTETISLNKNAQAIELTAIFKLFYNLLD